MTGFGAFPGEPLEGDPEYVAEEYYGPPAPPPMQGRKINSLDWVIVLCGGVALVFSYFSYYTYHAKTAAEQACAELANAPGPVASTLRGLCHGDSTSAWHGSYGGFGVLLAVLGACAVAAVALAPHVRFPGRLLGTAAFAIAVVCTVLAGLTVPDWSGKATLGIDAADYAAGVAAGPGSSYWIVLVAVTLGAAASYAGFTRAGSDRRVGG
jgi:hypothetical protein